MFGLERLLMQNHGKKDFDATKGVLEDAIESAVPGDLDKTILVGGRRIAQIHYAANRFREAEDLYRLILTYKEKVLGIDDADLASDVENLASALRAQGKLDEFKRLAFRAHALRQNEENGLSVDRPVVCGY